MHPIFNNQKFKNLYVNETLTKFDEDQKRTSNDLKSIEEEAIKTAKKNKPWVLDLLMSMAIPTTFIILEFLHLKKIESFSQTVRPELHASALQFYLTSLTLFPAVLLFLFDRFPLRNMSEVLIFHSPFRRRGLSVLFFLVFSLATSIEEGSFIWFIIGPIGYLVSTIMFFRLLIKARKPQKFATISITNLFSNREIKKEEFENRVRTLLDLAFLEEKEGQKEAVRWRIIAICALAIRAEKDNSDSTQSKYAIESLGYLGQVFREDRALALDCVNALYGAIETLDKPENGVFLDSLQEEIHRIFQTSLSQKATSKRILINTIYCLYLIDKRRGDLRFSDRIFATDLSSDNCAYLLPLLTSIALHESQERPEYTEQLIKNIASMKTEELLTLERLLDIQEGHPIMLITYLWSAYWLVKGKETRREINNAFGEAFRFFAKAKGHDCTSVQQLKILLRNRLQQPLKFGNNSIDHLIHDEEQIKILFGFSIEEELEGISLNNFSSSFQISEELSDIKKTWHIDFFKQIYEVFLGLEIVNRSDFFSDEFDVYQTFKEFFTIAGENESGTMSYSSPTAHLFRENQNELSFYFREKIVEAFNEDNQSLVPYFNHLEYALTVIYRALLEKDLSGDADHLNFDRALEKRLHILRKLRLLDRATTHIWGHRDSIREEARDQNAKAITDSIRKAINFNLDLGAYIDIVLSLDVSQVGMSSDKGLLTNHFALICLLGDFFLPSDDYLSKNEDVIREYLELKCEQAMTIVQSEKGLRIRGPHKNLGRKLIDLEYDPLARSFVQVYRCMIRAIANFMDTSKELVGLEEMEIEDVIAKLKQTELKRGQDQNSYREKEIIYFDIFSAVARLFLFRLGDERAIMFDRRIRDYKAFREDVKSKASQREKSEFAILYKRELFTLRLIELVMSSESAVSDGLRSKFNSLPPLKIKDHQ